MSGARRALARSVPLFFCGSSKISCAHARSMEPPKKRPRAVDFGHASHLSARALEAVLKQVRDEGLPEHFSAAQQRRERQEMLATDGLFGPVIKPMALPSASGNGTVSISFAHPLALLQKGMLKCSDFRNFVRRVLETCNFNVSIMLYSDEVTPGQVLQGDQTRKTECIYWSIKEFGYPALSHEAAWLTVATICTDLVATVEGGMNAIFKEVLRLFFGTASGEGGTSFDLRQGVVVQLSLDAEPIMLFGRMGTIVQDLLAHKNVLSIRGHNAVKLCSLCMNVVKHNAVCLQDDATGFLVPTTCLDVRRYKLHTDESVKGILRRLEDININNPARLAQLQVDFGFNYCKDNLFLDPHLNVSFVNTVVYDAMHVYFVDGLYVKELVEFCSRLDALELGGDSLHEYMQLWTWPKGVACPKNLCKLRGGKKNAPNGSASEFLSSAIVVRKWIVDVLIPKGVLPAECLSMLALLDVVDVIMHAQAGNVEPTTLEQLVLRHLRLHIDAYGDSLWAPKYHFALHLAKQLLEHGVLPTCWVLERKHRGPKRFMQGRLNKVAFSRGVLEDVSAQWLHELCDPTLPTSLISERPASKQLKDVMVSMGLATDDSNVTTSCKVIVKCSSISRGDVVLFNAAAGGFGVAHIWFHICINSAKMTCIAEWPITAQPHPSYVKAMVSNTPRLVDTGLLQIPVVYAAAEVGSISTVLLPTR